MMDLCWITSAFIAILTVTSCVAVSDELEHEDVFTAKLVVHPECQPEPMDMVKVYAGIANDLRTSDAAEAVETQINWGLILSPAPTSISMLGNLLLVTAKRDVSLTSGTPERGWQHVRHPNSLKASLVQVGGAAHRALLDAHKNMDAIRLHTQNVPIYFKQIVKMITKGSERERRRLIPTSLANIERVASECSVLANRTANGFKEVSLLLQELLEASIVQQKVSEGKKEELEIDLAETEEVARQAEEDVKVYKEMVKNAKKEMDKLFIRLQQVIDSAPSGWELIAASITDTLLGIFRSLSTNYERNTNKQQSFKNAVNCSKLADVILLHGYLQNELYTEGGRPLNFIKLMHKGQHEEARIGAFTLKSNLGNVQTRLSSYRDLPQEVNAKVLEIISEGQSVCTEIAEKSGALANSSLTALTNRSKEWKINVQETHGWIDQSFAKKEFPEMSPEAVKNIKRGGSDSIATTMQDMFRLRLAAQQQLLKAAQEIYESQQERLQRENRHAAEMMAKLKGLDMSHDNLEEAIDVLREAIAYLAKLQHQWHLMERFFNEIETLISVDWRTKLDNFVEDMRVMVEFRTTTARAISMFGDDNSVESKQEKFFDVGTDNIYKSAFRATALNYRVWRLASTYVRVSSAHFLPPLEKMNLLLMIDPATNNHTFLLERQKLNDALQNAQHDIVRLIKEDKQLLDNKVKLYEEQLHEQFKSLCPDEYQEDDTQAREIAEEANKRASEEDAINFM